MRENEMGRCAGIAPESSVPRRLVVGCCCGLCVILLCMLVSLYWRGMRQRTRVAALLNRGGSIQARYGVYHYEPPPTSPTVPETLETDEITLTVVMGPGQRAMGFSVVDDPPPYLKWMVPILGEHCFVRVTDIWVHLEEDQWRFSDADVDLLLAFPDLQAIDVANSAITDTGLAKLASIERLVRLDVSSTKVSAESLRRLSNCKRLKELDIRDTNATQEVVTYLEESLPSCLIRQ